MTLIKKILRNLNLFPVHNFWKTQGNNTYPNVCGGLISIPLIFLILALLTLRLIQMINYGVANTNTQVNINYDPIMTTLSTNPNDLNSSPFMLAFNAVIDNTSCPNTNLGFAVSFNQVRGAFGPANRTSSKSAITFEKCENEHFSVLAGKLGKVNQWTTNSLFCLKQNGYYQISGANTISDVYKNLQLAFTCPSSCSAAICGYVQLFSMSSVANIGNASSPFSYQLTRHKFSVYSTPKYQIAYKLDSTNITTDSSWMPTSSNKMVTGISVGNVYTDIPVSTTDNKNYITVERSDRSILIMRSYYKVFDLIAYIGGIFYCIIMLFSLVKQLSVIEFEMNFATECFRNAEIKKLSFREYMKQLIYRTVKETKWRFDWGVAEQRQETRQIVGKIMDVSYVNKRITYLQQAISLLFEQHQLKAIHLLCTMKKEQMKNKLHDHSLRDRVVAYMGRKYKHLDKPIFADSEERNNEQLQALETKTFLQHEDRDEKNDFINQFIVEQQKQEQKQQKQQKPLKQQKQQKQSRRYRHRKIISESLEQDGPHVGAQVLPLNLLATQLRPQHMLNSQRQAIKIFKAESQEIIQHAKPSKLTLKKLITQHYLGNTEKEQKYQKQPNLIVNEAEDFYSDQFDIQSDNKVIINSKRDKSMLTKEIDIVGENVEKELDQRQIAEELKKNIKKFLEEAESEEGSNVSKAIFGKLETWFKNYLRDVVKMR